MPINYQNGKIYKLVNNVDDEFYVGSTCNTLRQRKDGHKRAAKRERDNKTRVYQHIILVGWDVFEIILLESYPCNNVDELHARERYWIELLKPKLNMCIPTRTNKEWVQDNKEILTKKKKQNYQDNRAAILQQKKEYHQKNRDVILKKINNYYHNSKERRKEDIVKKNKKYREKNNGLVECDCGATIQKIRISRHYESKKHKFSMEFQQYILN